MDALDEIHCALTPFDGTDFGDPVLSGTALITNSVPTVESVQVLPSNPTEEDDLTCDAQGVEDPDGDPVELAFVWVVNQSPLLGQSGEVLDSTFTSVGDEVRCQVTPSDTNQGSGVWSADVLIVAASVELGPPEVNVIPETPEAGDSLTCEVDYPGGLDGLSVLLGLDLWIKVWLL